MIQGIIRNTKLCRTENRYFEGLSKMIETIIEKNATFQCCGNVRKLKLENMPFRKYLQLFIWPENYVRRKIGKFKLIH